jgi:hypothetical protein
MTDASESDAYAYTQDGYLSTVTIGGTLRAVDVRDAMGRVTSHTGAARPGALDRTVWLPVRLAEGRPRGSSATGSIAYDR